MPANPHWARWAFASVATFLKNVAEEAKLPVLIEGIDCRTSQFMQQEHRCEVRITGPFVREMSKDYYELEMLVNVILLSRYSKNQYATIKNAGIFQEAMNGPLAVYKYGAEPGDDERAWVGCLVPLQNRGDAVRVLHFGHIDPTVELKQSMVDARYSMELSSIL